MLNAIIDTLLNATIYTAIVYFLFALIATLTIEKTTVTSVTTDTTDTTDTTVTTVTSDEQLDVVKMLPSFSTMTVIELRNLCGQTGIQWRNAYGKGKHMRKVDMLTALAV